MRMRSLLFVPGDSPRKFEKAASAGADVLILDLEDSVAPEKKGVARRQVSEWLEQADRLSPALFVRVSAIDPGPMVTDLAEVVKPGLAGLLLPKVNGSGDVARAGHYLDALEARAGVAPGTVGIAVIASETPSAMFNLGSYAPAHPRLVALTWGAEDLSAAIGATDSRNADGSWATPYQIARAQCLFAAASAAVAAIETVYTNFSDSEGLERDCRQARRDGFSGRLAIHPAQVEIINRCFTPSEEEIASARRVIEAFAAQPGAGTVAIDGRMYDLPHLKAARNILSAIGG